MSSIFKKSDDMKTNNYIPISILVVFSKVFEKIMAHKVMNYLK